MTCTSARPARDDRRARSLLLPLVRQGAVGSAALAAGLQAEFDWKCVACPSGLRRVCSRPRGERLLGAVFCPQVSRQISLPSTRGPRTAPTDSSTTRLRVLRAAGPSTQCTACSRWLITATAALQPSKMWGTADWNWGSIDGYAHDAAAEFRSAFSTERQRQHSAAAGEFSRACFAHKSQRHAAGALQRRVLDSRGELGKPGLRNSRRARAIIRRYNLNVQLSVKPQRLTESTRSSKPTRQRPRAAEPALRAVESATTPKRVPLP